MFGNIDEITSYDMTQNSVIETERVVMRYFLRSIKIIIIIIILDKIEVFVHFSIKMGVLAEMFIFMLIFVLSRI